jgi:hypothetical protein
MDVVEGPKRSPPSPGRRLPRITTSGGASRKQTGTGEIAKIALGNGAPLKDTASVVSSSIWCRRDRPCWVRRLLPGRQEKSKRETTDVKPLGPCSGCQGCIEVRADADGSRGGVF